MEEQMIYCFGNKGADGDAGMKAVLGGKGANLAEMSRLGVPVPPGFTIPTTLCSYYHEHGEKVPDALTQEAKRGLSHIESLMNRKFGDAANPLLVSVRSGAASSMPGMMDTILNLGLNDKTVKGLAARSQNPRFAFDSYRRFIQMYGEVVQDLPYEGFEEILDAQKRKKGVKLDTELDAADLHAISENYLALIQKATEKAFPQDPTEQLWGAIRAVFRSWNSKRAIEYRRIHKLDGLGGTAVNIQAMVFGNMGDNCATGVAFTRDPSTGAKVFFGEYLVNAQGEDVVAGIRTPQPIDRMSKEMPKAYAELTGITDRLERHFRDMQDIEFTVEDGRLWMLQTRIGKRASKAAIKIAVDMVAEKLITPEEAVLRVSPEQLDQLLHPMCDPKVRRDVVGIGLAASPGAAVGQVVFDADEAVEWAHNGKKVILVRVETSPDDIQGMHVAEGFLTARGGLTSHAAVVARGMGKPCVVGCQGLQIDYSKKTVTFSNGKMAKEGDWMTIDGTSGEIMEGSIPLVDPTPDDDFKKLMSWADKFRKLRVRVNGDTPADMVVARELGAEGVGLCRTEHMFFAEDRLELVREMIVAATREARQKALDGLLPIQRGDFEAIFRKMDGLPVTVRLLDPPLHEFLPSDAEQKQRLAKKTGVPLEQLDQKLANLHEANPMLGHRGCRLAITFPEIYEMQVRAIMEAACRLQKEEKIRVIPEIEVPLVAHVNELKILRAMIDKTCAEVMHKAGVKVEYKVGTMIELPRAAITAHQIAEYADFFSFGTNDLTQTTFGLSRDDSGKFLPAYLDQKVVGADPFVSIDTEGVGAMMQLAVERGRKTKPNLEIGICGEHGGEPASVVFCHNLGLQYVSCSPYRLPIARLAAAHAALREKNVKASDSR